LIIKYFIDRIIFVCFLYVSIAHYVSNKYTPEQYQFHSLSNIPISTNTLPNIDPQKTESPSTSIPDDHLPVQRGHLHQNLNHPTEENNFIIASMLVILGIIILCVIIIKTLKWYYIDTNTQR
jgi:hypothetical protein